MKRGFTLVELLGVIVILGIIGLIIVPVVQGTLKTSSENLCEEQKKIYEKAAKNYVASNPYLYDKNSQEEGDDFSISLQELINKGFLEDDNNSDKEQKVIIEYKAGKFKFSYDGNC